MQVLLYGCDGDPDSEAMKSFLKSRGIGYELRCIDDGGPARQEWEDLDGQVTPVVVIDRSRIVRGMDAIRLDQFMGSVGC
jgi:glutaredoxin